MNAMIPRKPFAERFAAAASVAPTRSPKAILQQCKLTIDADGDGTLTATDLEVGITLDVPGCKASEPGSVILPTKRFGDILTRSADDELSLSVDGGTIVVRGLRSEFKLPADDPALFPATPEPDGDVIVMAADDLRRMIRRTIYATDAESPRYALGGVRFAATKGGFVAIATDGRRLARQVLDGPINTERTPVLPIKALRLIDRACEGDDAVALTLGTTAAWLRIGGTTIHTRLVEGRFPAYESFFPIGRTATATITAAELLAAIEQAAITTSEESRGVDLAFAPGELVLRSAAADVGKSIVRLPLAYEGEPIALTFDHRYMSDALKSLDGGTLLDLELFGLKMPLVVKAEGFTYVVMPLTRD